MLEFQLVMLLIGWSFKVFFIVVFVTGFIKIWSHTKLVTYKEQRLIRMYHLLLIYEKEKEKLKILTKENMFLSLYLF